MAKKLALRLARHPAANNRSTSAIRRRPHPRNGIGVAQGDDLGQGHVDEVPGHDLRRLFRGPATPDRAARPRWHPRRRRRSPGRAPRGGPERPNTTRDQASTSARESPASRRGAAGPPSTTSSAGSDSSPPRIDTQPATTSRRPRRAHSVAIRNRGDAPPMARQGRSSVGGETTETEASRRRRQFVVRRSVPRALPGARGRRIAAVPPGVDRHPDGR